MRFTFFILLSIFLTGSLIAQVPEDALRYSWMRQKGTARNQAVGGAMGSLGGDITATFVNPAGLGLYKTGEFVLSPGFKFFNNNSQYRESSASAKDNAFNFGTSGFVLGFGNNSRKWKGSAISIAVNRTASFNNNIYYKGQNDLSSYSEQYAEELANSRIPVERAFDDNSLSLGTRMALYTYLIDTATINGVKQIIGLPELLGSRDQENRIQTTGGITEISLGAAGNMDDKFYVGGSIGLPIVNYERTNTFTETDPSGNTNNNFNRSTLREVYTTKGLGLNAKFGIIFKPVDLVRVGLAVHTPTIYGLKDTYTADMTTDTENYPPSPGLVDVSSDVLTGNQLTQYEYDMVSPWKIMLSGSYVFREVEDVTRQRGFISADVEFVNHKSSSFSSAGSTSDDNYYDGINSTIDDIYKSTINVRLGGELKFNTFMARGGFSYYGNPYTDSELKARQMFISGGLGYRNKGFFVDFTYVHGLLRDVNFPYRLSDKANTFAEVKGSSGNVLMTFGFKF
ncbi:MAG: aromatic hydrocarbon degradation protein [Chitinophagaceae bacterium]